LDVAKAWGAALDVLHVKSNEPVFTAEKAKDIYERMAATANYTLLHFEEIASDDVTDAIEGHVQATNSDILCMATHRRNLLERIFNRSKTKAIAHHTNIPLLSIRKA
jgi:nucleotide-binding universal stress UspA family protein